VYDRAQFPAPTPHVFAHCNPNADILLTWLDLSYHVMKEASLSSSVPDLCSTGLSSFWSVSELCSTGMPSYSTASRCTTFVRMYNCSLGAYITSTSTSSINTIVLLERYSYFVCSHLQPLCTHLSIQVVTTWLYCHDTREPVF
jgi:hypothetical protein